MTKENWSLSD